MYPSQLLLFLVFYYIIGWCHSALSFSNVQLLGTSFAECVFKKRYCECCITETPYNGYVTALPSNPDNKLILYSVLNFCKKICGYMYTHRHDEWWILGSAFYWVSLWVVHRCYIHGHCTMWLIVHQGWISKSAQDEKPLCAQIFILIWVIKNKKWSQFIHRFLTSIYMNCVEQSPSWQANNTQLVKKSSAFYGT